MEWRLQKEPPVSYGKMELICDMVLRGMACVSGAIPLSMCMFPPQRAITIMDTDMLLARNLFDTIEDPYLKEGAK